MSLERLPSVITENLFNKKGLVNLPRGLLVPAYVGSGQGFNFPGVFFLSYFYPRLQQEAGVLPLCPFRACGEYLDFSRINEDTKVRELFSFWVEFNRDRVGPVNYQTLMPKSKMMIAILEGQSIDEGLAGEIPEFLHTNPGPLIGIRSDFRITENVDASINPANRYFLDYGPYKDRSFYILGPPVKETYDRAIIKIKQLADKIRQE